ncbi:15770_t:CDS:1, partial [Gigaspora margarita]
ILDLSSHLKVKPPSSGTTTIPMVPFGCKVRVPSNDCTTEGPVIIRL